MFATYEGGSFIEVNETDANYTTTTIVLLNETVWVDLGEYHIYGVQALRGDNLNIKVEVLDDGGPIDYFIMETDKKEQFDGWFNGTEVKFFRQRERVECNVLQPYVHRAQDG